MRVPLHQMDTESLYRLLAWYIEHAEKFRVARTKSPFFFDIFQFLAKKYPARVVSLVSIHWSKFFYIFDVPVWMLYEAMFSLTHDIHVHEAELAYFRRLPIQDFALELDRMPF